MDNREPQVLDPLMASQHEYVRSNEYCYDRENKNLLVRFSDDGTIEKYVYGNGLIASYETAISEADGTPVTKYQTYVYDIRGSVILAVDAAGNTTAEYQYSTYGDRNVISGPDDDELGYCARDGVLTEQSGLLYMRARYYYPELMRFINQDIVTGDISNSSSLNRYAYVNGNPVTLIDPFGLCAERTIRGATSTMWGSCEIFMGCGAVEAGTAMMAVPLPGCRILGFGLIAFGVWEAWFGANDVTEGAQDVACGVLGISDDQYRSVNVLRDYGFHGDYEAYYNTEMFVTYFNAVGMEYANTKMWAADNSKPDISKWADYDNLEDVSSSSESSINANKQAIIDGLKEAPVEYKADPITGEMKPYMKQLQVTEDYKVILRRDIGTFNHGDMDHWNLEIQTNSGNIKYDNHLYMGSDGNIVNQSITTPKKSPFR